MEQDVLGVEVEVRRRTRVEGEARTACQNFDRCKISAHGPT